MIRNFLLAIRRVGAKLTRKRIILLSILAVTLIIAGVLIDTFLPFNFLINTIRAIIAVSLSLLFFGSLYLYATYRMNKIQETKTYKPVRKRFTYIERRNISIFMWVFLAVALLLAAARTPGYTFINSWIIVGIYSILSFTRSTRDEYMRTKYGIPDPKQIDFNQAVKNNLREGQEKLKKNHK